MTKTYFISRDDLKAKLYKKADVKETGNIPAKRDPTLLVQVLKKALTT